MKIKETKTITLEEEFEAIMRVRSVDSDNAMEWAKGFIAYADANPDAMRDEGEVGMWFTNAMLRGMRVEQECQREASKRSRAATVALEIWDMLKVAYVLAGTLAMVMIFAAWQSGALLDR